MKSTIIAKVEKLIRGKTRFLTDEGEEINLPSKLLPELDIGSEFEITLAKSSPDDDARKRLEAMIN